MNKPKVYLAGPLFNPVQIAILEKLERLLTTNGYEFFSPRLHSGSDSLSPEDRKNFDAWTPVFQKNEEQLNECDIMIAVLEYALPVGDALCLASHRQVPRNSGIYKDDSTKTEWTIKTSIELPDSGTVFEMGYFRALDKQVVGYHTTKMPTQLNLMLTHGCVGICTGLNSFATVFQSDGYASVFLKKFNGEIE